MEKAMASTEKEWLCTALFQIIHSLSMSVSKGFVEPLLISFFQQFRMNRLTLSRLVTGSRCMARQSMYARDQFRRIVTGLSLICGAFQ
jgi:hypothetical protein